MNAALVLTGMMSLVPPQDASNVSLRGTVMDVKGRPIAGARVNIHSAAPRIGQGLFCPTCYKDCTKWTRSDDGGRFEIPGLDPTLKFTVLASYPDKKAFLTSLVDPHAGELKIVLESLPTDFPRDRTVNAEVVDDREQPLSGVLVEAHAVQVGGLRRVGKVNIDPTVTDKDGRFRMLLPKDYNGVDVRVIAPGYAGSTVELKPGLALQRVVVPSGTRVTGRLVREGKAMPGLRVAVVQMNRSAMHHFIKAVGDVTDDEGKFTIDYLPANEPYAIFTLIGEGSPQKFVITSKKFMASDNRQKRDLGSLEVVAPLRIAGRLELAPGDSVPPESKIALDRNPAWDLIAVPVNADGSFVIDGLPPETYTIHVAAKGFVIDGSRLPFQALSPVSFGIRLSESANELRVPLVRTASKE